MAGSIVGLVCFRQNKKHQAVESPFHVHRSSVDQNCGRISIERTAAIKKKKTVGESSQTDMRYVIY